MLRERFSVARFLNRRKSEPFIIWSDSEGGFSMLFENPQSMKFGRREAGPSTCTLSSRIFTALSSGRAMSSKSRELLWEERWAESGVWGIT